MSISNLGTISTITSQITTGAPQAGFRCDPSASPATNSSPAQGSAQLLHLDLSGRKGYQEDYSIRDAAESLWKQETQTFHLKDLEDPEKSSEILENLRQQVRWDLGIDSSESKDEALSAYIQNLRQNGLDGSIDWSGLSRELEAFQTTTPEELADGLDYLASRYTAARDKLERNYTGEELTSQLAKLEEVYQAGKAGMIDGYTRLLQDNLGLSDRDAQAVRDSFSTILSEKVEAYCGALEQVHKDAAQTGPDHVWLKDHDAYIASQLRAAGNAGQSQARYSIQDLTAAGQIAQSYRTEIADASSCGRNEATLALNLAMADMKAETLIAKGLVSENMAALLRNSRAQGHENALAALDQALAQRENSRAPGEPKGSFASVDRSVFQGIYGAVLNAYQHNGGDGAEAIRAGAAYGQNVTAQATSKNPQALRWGVNIESYWKNFYTAPDDREVSPLDQQVNRLMIQLGKTPSLGSSTYQKFADSWRDFLTGIGGNRLNLKA